MLIDTSKIEWSLMGWSQHLEFQLSKVGNYNYLARYLDVEVLLAQQV